MYPTELDIKGRLKNNFQTASLYRKQPARSKIKVQAAFCDDWKNARYFYTVYCADTMQNNITQRNPYV